MNKRGFTVIEIAVVTIIIGLLAVLGSVAIVDAVNRSRIKQAEAELDVLSAAVLQLAWDTGQWPNARSRIAGGSVERWNISLAQCGLFNTDGNYDNWKGPYYDGPTEDPWGNRYFFDPDYHLDGKMRVAVGSFGPNGVGPNLYDSDDVYVLLDD